MCLFILFYLLMCLFIFCFLFFVFFPIFSLFVIRYSCTFFPYFIFALIFNPYPISDP